MNQALIALACDKNYAPYSIRLARRVAELHPQRDFDICIFSLDNLELPQQCKTLGITTCQIPDQDIAPPHSATGRHGLAAYIRLQIPRMIKGKYKRLLYMDTDIICEQSGLSDLIHADLGNYCIGAVRDNKQWRTPNKRVPEFAAIRAARHPYFNTGVLLINVDGWNEQGIGRRALRVITDLPEAIFHSDQSALNIAIQGQWAEMSPVWNWQYTYASRFYIDIAEPRLIHFIGPRKPWNDQSRELPARFRRFFAEEKQPPGAPKPCRDTKEEAMSWPSNLRKSFWKHYMSCKSMKKYLDRFADPCQLLDARSGQPLGRDHTCPPGLWRRG